MWCSDGVHSTQNQGKVQDQQGTCVYSDKFKVSFLSINFNIFIAKGQQIPYHSKNDDVHRILHLY